MTKRRTRTKAPGVYRSVSGRYEITYRDSNGRLVFETVADTLEEAKTIRAEKIAKLGRGERVVKSPVIFREFAEEWMRTIQRKPRRTIDAYRYALNRHLLPRFGRRKLASITTDDVARLVADMQRQKHGKRVGYAPWTIQGTLSTLSGIMGKAKRRGLGRGKPRVGAWPR